VQEYCTHLRNLATADTHTDLRNRELELKCQRLEQQLAMNEATTREEMINAGMELVADAMGEYRARLQAWAGDDAAREPLNRLIAESIEIVKAKYQA
jgi:hypothetical protein